MNKQSVVMLLVVCANNSSDPVQVASLKMRKLDSTTIHYQVCSSTSPSTLNFLSSRAAAQEDVQSQLRSTENLTDDPVDEQGFTDTYHCE